MFTVTFRFYSALNDFLSSQRPEGPIVCTLKEHAAVKHPIESIGIPHPEVGAIYANDRPVDFTYLLRDGDHVDVFPCGGLADLEDYLPLRPPAPQPVRFILDTHLGQLANYLRLLGFDSLYRNDFTDEEIARLAEAEQRVILTRDRGLLKRKIVVHGYCVRETAPRQQITSVLRRYELAGQVDPWSRCARCNGMLVTVEKDEVLQLLEPKTRLHYEEFQRCSACGQIYWQGSHFEKLADFVMQVLAEVRER